MKRYNVKPDKKRGQSFLWNQLVARDIVAYAKLSSNDSVLEIGGGLGVLTRWIAEQVEKVHVIEIEPGLVAALRDRTKDLSNVRVVEGDALTVDLPEVNKIISNLPYRISSEVTFRLLKEMDFDSAVLMYQKEFAERLMAEPGSSEYSRLSVNFQYLASATLLMDVDPKEFYPVPAVSSSVVKVQKRRSGPFAKETGIFEWMIRGIYSYPNKNLRNALRIWFRNLGAEKTMADVLIERCKDMVSPSDKLRFLDMHNLVALSDEVAEMVVEGKIPQP